VAKPPKAEKGAYIEVYYGINSRMNRVDRVYRTNDGKLESTVIGSPLSVSIRPGVAALDEVALIYGLTDIFYTRIEFAESEPTKKKIAELEAKAAAG
jgi:hypothetical protein